MLFPGIPAAFSRDFKILLLVHKCIYGLAPVYLRELITLSYNFSHTGNMLTVKTRYASSDGAFSVCAPHLWNSLPTMLKFEGSNVQFKRKLKEYLFNCS